MEELLLFGRLFAITENKLCRRLALPAGLVLLCAALALLAGRAAEQAFSEGVDFSGVVLAVTAPDGDGVPELVERFLGSMRDVRAYCRVEAMPRDAALDALGAGEVTAVLELPESFVRGVQQGENPDVRLIVDARRPLGALLTLWLGRSAADLLASVQCGIYAVLDVCALTMPEGVSYERVVTEINLRYVQWVLNRQDLFSERPALPTGQLPVALHYELSVLWFLLLALAPAFAWCFQGVFLSYLRRLRFAGRSALWGFFASLLACALMAGALFFAALELVLRAPALSALVAALFGALFFAAYAALCALLTHDAAGCGTLAFVLNAAFLILAGGVIPPALLPDAIRRLESLSPLSRLRALSAAALGFDAPRAAAYLALVTAALVLLCAALYLRRAQNEEAPA